MVGIASFARVKFFILAFQPLKFFIAHRLIRKTKKRRDFKHAGHFSFFSIDCCMKIIVIQVQEDRRNLLSDFSALIERNSIWSVIPVKVEIMTVIRRFWKFIFVKSMGSGIYGMSHTS